MFLTPFFKVSDAEVSRISIGALEQFGTVALPAAPSESYGYHRELNPALLRCKPVAFTTAVRSVTLNLANFSEVAK